MPENFNTHISSEELQSGFISVSDFLNIFRRRKKLIYLVASVTFAVSIIFTIYKRIYNPVFLGSFTLLITDPLDDIERNKANYGSTLAFEKLAINSTVNDLPTLVRLLKSKSILQPISEKYEIPYQQLFNKIKISVPGKDPNSQANGIIEVSYSGSKPYRMNKILESLKELYLQTAVTQKGQRVADGLNFLNKQSPALEAKTESIQNKLSAFRKKYNLIEPIEEGMRIKNAIGKTKDEIISLETYNKRLLDIKYAIEENKIDTVGFLAALKPDAISSSEAMTISNSDRVLIGELLNVKKSLAEVRSKYKSSSPIVKGLEDRLNKLTPILKENQLEAVNTSIMLNNRRIEILNEKLFQLKERFNLQPDLIKEYESLMQNLTIAKRNLEGIVTAKEKFQLEIAQRSVPWEVIASPEVDPIPISPSLSRNAAFGVIISALLSFLVGYLKDRSDFKFHRIEEVQNELNLPNLAFLPHFSKFNINEGEPANWLESLKSFENDNLDELERFVFQESFRNLSTSVRFLIADNSMPILSISSSIPGEGKTFISIILAKTLSELGSKVLLIDADLRKPQIHKRLELNNIKGLSNVLTSDADFYDVIQKVKGLPLLSIVTAGIMPPDPLNLLSSDRYKSLIEEIRSKKEFDIVIIDTTPVLGLSDSSYVSQYTDGCVLIVSLEKVPRNLPKESKDIISGRNAKVLGTIINYVDEDKSKSLGVYGSNNYSQSRYGYGNNYVYSYSKYGSNKEVPEFKNINKEKIFTLREKFSVNYIKEKFKKIISWFND